MSGTVSGGKLAAQTNKKRYGEDYYRIQGAKGGQVSGIPKGFALSGKASTAGSTGGKISRRGATVYVNFNGKKTSLSEVARQEQITYRNAHQRMVAGKYERI